MPRRIELAVGADDRVGVVLFLRAGIARPRRAETERAGRASRHARRRARDRVTTARGRSGEQREAERESETRAHRPTPTPRPKRNSFTCDELVTFAPSRYMPLLNPWTRPTWGTTTYRCTRTS